MSSQYSLVIVESPAKCKKIEEYLGPGYKCLASFGHLRELNALKDIDIENNYNPNYSLCKDERKAKNISKIRIAIHKAEEVLLATDDDREGEAIAWHICKVFELPVEKTKRIIFHEITESALRSAVLNPTKINMSLVQSQQARQILDLIVGFQITPILWSAISKNNKLGLSAGRCQTPALRLIYDNYLEIKETPGSKVYNTIGYFTNHCIPFELNKHFDSEEVVIEFLKASSKFQHIFTRNEPKKLVKQAPQPLTTSRIQQLASNEMKMSPKETMKTCQSLYESGYITYMRTDSSKYCNDFINSTKEYIVKTYNDEKYIHPNISSLSNIEIVETLQDNAKPLKKGVVKEKSKSKKKCDVKEAQNGMQLQNGMQPQNGMPPPQEAHEAIRPTNITLTELSEKATAKEKKLYKLIWERSLESCMAPAETFQVTSNISTSYPDTKYSFSCELMEFPGWKIVCQKNMKEAEKDAKEYNYIQSIKQNLPIDYKKITSAFTLKELKHHYSEAKLVQTLEEKGIGRPSTFSMIIDKIQEREYVKKEDIIGKQIECNDFSLEEKGITKISSKKTFGNEKGKLVIQPLGVIVIEFLLKNFGNIFDYDYTKKMEDELDIISKGGKIWHQLCDNCYKDIDSSIKNAGDEIKKKTIEIDAEHSYIIGKNGPVIKCTQFSKDGKQIVTFKPVKNDIDIHKLENGGYTLDEIIDKSNLFIILGDYEGHPLTIRKGKYGLYATWENKTKNLSCFGNRPMENISFEDVKEILDKDLIAVGDNSDETPSARPSSIVRQISSNISIRTGKFGDYIFYKSPKMTKPMFLKIGGFKGDYKTCHIDILQNWIKDEYGFC
jgi:DNA topoisomerase-1